MGYKDGRHDQAKSQASTATQISDRNIIRESKKPKIPLFCLGIFPRIWTALGPALGPALILEWFQAGSSGLVWLACQMTVFKPNQAGPAALTPLNNHHRFSVLANVLNSPFLPTFPKCICRWVLQQYTLSNSYSTSGQHKTVDNHTRLGR